MRYLLTVSILAVAALAVAAPATRNAAKKDNQSVVGDWELQSCILSGVVDESAQGTLELTADGMMVISKQGNVFTLTYAIRPDKEPPEIDWVVQGTLLMYGIVKIEGDNLTLCMVTIGARPKKFESPANSVGSLTTYKRVKAKE